MLIELIDGGIKEIYTDTESHRGCDTCDYGSKYINEFKIELTTGNIIFEVSQMYEYPLSEGYMIKLFLENIEEIKQLNEVEFYEWLEGKLEKEVKGKVEKFKLDFRKKGGDDFNEK